MNRPRVEPVNRPSVPSREKKRIETFRNAINNAREKETGYEEEEARQQPEGSEAEIAENGRI